MAVWEWLIVKQKALASIASVISGSGSGRLEMFEGRVWCEVQWRLRQSEGLNACGLGEGECF